MTVGRNDATQKELWAAARIIAMTIKCSCRGCGETWTLAESKSPNSDELRGVIDRAVASGDAMEVDAADRYVSEMATFLARDDGWGFLFDGAAVCPEHNMPRGGFRAFCVQCGHPGCHATHLRHFHVKHDTMENADDSASHNALIDGGWGLAADKSLRCHAHSPIVSSIVVETTMIDEFSTHQAVTAAGRIEIAPESFATARSMRGKRIRITIEVSID